MLDSTNDLINNIYQIDKNNKRKNIEHICDDEHDKNNNIKNIEHICDDNHDKNNIKNIVEDILNEIKNLNNNNNLMRNNIESNNQKKRKLEKFLFDNCDHNFKFAYREPHERATYICTKCNCYDDKYYYQY